MGASENSPIVGEFREAYSFARSVKGSYHNVADQRNVGKEPFMSLDNQSLAHTSWNCKYHIVFAPKYRRKEFYGLKRLEIGAILRKLCEWKQITIHEATRSLQPVDIDNEIAELKKRYSFVEQAYLGHKN